MSEGLSSSSSSFSSLSLRGRGVRPVREDDSVFTKALSDPFHPDTNPDGTLIMLVAENKLMWRDVREKLHENATRFEPSPDEWVFSYGSFTGHPRLKRTLARLMERWTITPRSGDDGDQLQERAALVDPDCIRVQAGVGSVLTQLSYLLGDPGDAVLTPGPVYPAFPEMVKVYGQLVLHVATPSSEDCVPKVEDLQKAYDRALTEGHPPSILLLCQPHNPTGIVYTRETMRLMIEWALEHGLHVVSDEIYALSIFPGERTVSAAGVLREMHPDHPDDGYLGNHVHVVAGVSKDWAMSGFRVGWVFSHNRGVLEGMDRLGAYQSPSQHTQHTLACLFEDEEWMDFYLKEYSSRLHQTYRALEEALTLVGVPLPHAMPKGGLFVWADFSGFLREGQSEQELWEELFREARVLFTTGESCFGDKPGFFRIVYAWPEGGPEAMRELGRRLVKWKVNREHTTETNRETDTS